MDEIWTQYFLGTNVLKYDFEVITYEDLKYEIQALE